MAGHSLGKRAASVQDGEVSLAALKGMVGGAGGQRSEPVDPQLLAAFDDDLAADTETQAPPAKLEDKAADHGAGDKLRADLYDAAFEASHNKPKVLKTTLSKEDAAVKATGGFTDISHSFSGSHFEDKIAKAKDQLARAGTDVVKARDVYQAADAERTKVFGTTKDAVKAFSEARQNADQVKESWDKKVQAAREPLEQAGKDHDAAHQRFEGTKSGIDKAWDAHRQPGLGKIAGDVPGERARSASLGGTPSGHSAPALKDLKPAIDQFRVAKTDLEKFGSDLDHVRKSYDETKRTAQEKHDAAEASKVGAKDKLDIAKDKLKDATKVRDNAGAALEHAEEHEKQQAKNLEKARENVKTKDDADKQAKAKPPTTGDKLREQGNKLYDKLADKALTKMDDKVKADAKAAGNYHLEEDVHHFFDPVLETSRQVEGNKTTEKTHLVETAYRESEQSYHSGDGQGAKTKLALNHIRYDETRTTTENGDGTKTITIEKSSRYAGLEGEAGYIANKLGASGKVEDKLVLDWTDETIKIEDAGTSRQIDTEGHNAHSESGIKAEGKLTANGFSGDVKIYSDNTATDYRERSYEHEDGSTTTVKGKVFGTAGGYAGVSGEFKVDPLTGGISSKGKIGMETYAGFGAGAEASHYSASGNGGKLSGEVNIGKVGAEADYDFSYEDGKLGFKGTVSGGGGIIGGKATVEGKGDLDGGIEVARSGTFFDYSREEKVAKARLALNPHDPFLKHGLFNKYAADPSPSFPETKGEVYYYGGAGPLNATPTDLPPLTDTLETPAIEIQGQLQHTWVPAVMSPEPSFGEKLLNTALAQPRFWAKFFG